MKLPEIEKRMHSKKEFLDDLAMTFGGMVTEEEIFGDVTTGPQGDIQMATSLARNMVMRYGMSESIGPIALVNEKSSMLPGIDGSKKDFSSEMAAKVDKEVRRILDEAKERARNIILENKNLLDVIAKKLLEVEILERDEYEEILKLHGVKIKPREGENNDKISEQK